MLPRQDSAFTTGRGAWEYAHQAQRFAAVVEWMEKVTDEQYAAGVGAEPGDGGRSQ